MLREVEEWLNVYLEQESTDIFCQGPDRKYFRVFGPYSLWWMWLWSNKTLFMDTEF